MRPQRMLRSKGAFLYTLVSLVLISIILFSTYLYQDVDKNREKSQVYSTRIHQMDHLSKNIRQDIERAMFTVSFRAILSLQSNLVSTGTYYPDVDQAFNELYFNGSVGNETMPLMQDSTITDWFSNFNSKAQSNGIVLEWEVKEIQVSHSDPWNLEIRMEMQYLLTDTADTASWNITDNFTAQVSIDSLEDPIYIMETFGQVPNTITRTNVTDFVSGSDISELKVHLHDSMYVESDAAPSYWMRLEGNFNPSPYGIESMVNLEKLSAQGLPVVEKSVIDHIYFSAADPARYIVSGMPAWFRLDNLTMESTTRLDYYEVEGLV